MYHLREKMQFQQASLEIDPGNHLHPFPLTDVQQAYCLGRKVTFEGGNVGNHGYIEVDALDLDLERFTMAIQRLIDTHDMLRAIVFPDGQQQVLEHVPHFSYRLRICGDGTSKQEKTVYSIFAKRWITRFSPESSGPHLHCSFPS